MDQATKRAPLTREQAEQIADALMAAEPRLADRIPRATDVSDDDDWVRRPVGSLGTLRPSWRSLP